MFLIDCMAKSIATGPWVTGCTSIACIPTEIANITTFIYNVIRIVTPLILVIIGMFDMAKSITAGKEDEIKRAQQLLIKRAIAAAIIFLLFSLITWVLSILGSTGDENQKKDTQNIITCLNSLFNANSNENSTLATPESECQRYGYDGVLKLIGSDINGIKSTYTDLGFSQDSYYACYKYYEGNSKCNYFGTPDNAIKFRFQNGEEYCVLGGLVYGDNYIPACANAKAANCSSCCQSAGYINSFYSTSGCMCVR